MNSEIFIAHPENSEQIKALKAVVKAFKIKFEVRKENEYLNFFDDLKSSLSQVKKMKEGKLRKQTAKEFLDEL